MRGVRVGDGVRCWVWLARADGVRVCDVAAVAGVSDRTVRRIAHDARVETLVRGSSVARLTLGQREEISRSIVEGVSNAEIGRRIGRHRSTVGREIAAHGGREVYRATGAHRLACERAKRPKRSKLETHPLLRAVVEDWLEEFWSPQQISARLVDDFPDDESMRVAPETIYQALFVHGRGGLRRELVKCLRSQREQRRPHAVTARNRQRSSIPDAVSIAQRPDEIEDRTVPGHWEGDLIMGKNNSSQVATLVERTTGLVMLCKLPSKQADVVAAALAVKIQTLPDLMQGSLTWDRGTEMADHRDFTIATEVQVYFCDPHAPWQRGSNENTNGLLRQYLPRDTDLSRHNQAELDAIARSLNGRPRKRHKYRTPLEVFDQLVLH